MNLADAINEQKYDLAIKIIKTNNSGKGYDLEEITNGTTPLYKSVWDGELILVKKLISAGAQVDTPSPGSRWTPLMAAANNGHNDILIALLDAGANINNKDHQGRTPLFMAAFGGHEDVVRTLIDKGADVTLMTIPDHTPLMIAANNGHNNILIALLDAGADINNQDNQGLTPLFMATFEGHEDVVRTLINKGADVTLMTIRGETPLMIAKENGHDSIVDIFEEHEEHEEHVWPAHFNCPITMNVMKDPVTTRGDIEKAAGSGEYSARTYERAAIKEWIRQHPPGSDPLTREPLLATDLVPNEALKREMWEAGVRPLLGAETSRGGGK